jgi:hypothetical protein
MLADVFSVKTEMIDQEEGHAAVLLRTQTHL